MLGAELGVMKFRLDGGKLEGKRAADARMKCSQSTHWGSQRQVVEIYGKLQKGSLHHYTDSSIIYANGRREGTESTDYTDKLHFHH